MQKLVPTNKQKRVRAQRCHLAYSRNEDFGKEKEERELKFKRQMKERDVGEKMKAQYEQYNMRQNQIMEYVRLCRPELFTRPRQLSGLLDHFIRNGEHQHRPWEQLPRHRSTAFIPLEQRKRPGEHPSRPRRNSLDLRRHFTCMGRSLTDTGRCLSYHWSSAKNLRSSLADPRCNSLDLQSCFTCLESILTDLKMIVSVSSMIISVLGRSSTEYGQSSKQTREIMVHVAQERTSGIGYLGCLRVDLTWIKPNLKY
ncbi:uncharacterized protein LOC113330735 isoform X2 [Papaver somniferum]|uniref:uncharacterized protein LOC113330735 isoform X2 n=1 Tax=Papaver somniferum TaxID=3469 RepID=UPI000E700BB7|nr:uncharacterized protein LOC113330735 isoform X2 [Papaver somniferum]